MKLGFRNLKLGNGTRHSERSATKRRIQGRFCSMRSGVTFASLVLCLSSFVLFSACTDYVSQMEDDFEDWKKIQAELDEGSLTDITTKSSSSKKVSSSSVKANSSSKKVSSSSVKASSSSKKVSSSSVTLSEVKGSFTDSRDGQVYKTVKIGSQMWMAENLNYKAENSRCGGGSGTTEGDCSKYGRLYTWSIAKNACPSGWHLPSEEEWNTLFMAVSEKSTAGKVLKSSFGWYDNGNGTDDFGFSALPAGYSADNNYYYDEGKHAYFWIFTEYDLNNAYYVNLAWGNGVEGMAYGFKHSRYSVRCLKDEASSSVTPTSSSAGNSADVGGSTYNTLTDSRDGQVYKTVKIGSQIWMAENLNYKAENSWCGGGSGTTEGDCSKYGRLYTWATAMDSAGTWSTNGKGCGDGKTCSVASAGSATLVRGVCPDGWHLPSQTEWHALFIAVGGSTTDGIKLMSSSGWNNGGNGTDDYRFSALPAGLRIGDGSFVGYGSGAYFWSSTEYDGSVAYTFMDLNYHYDDENLYNKFKYFGLSVRCLKD